MKIKQFEVWIADLNPQMGTEPGKIRPVVVVQSNLLNPVHPSTIICPISTNIQPGATLLRVNLTHGTAGLDKDSAILIDQIRSIDNKRLVKRLGILDKKYIDMIRENLSKVLDFDNLF